MTERGLPARSDLRGAGDRCRRNEEVGDQVNEGIVRGSVETDGEQQV